MLCRNLNHLAQLNRRLWNGINFVCNNPKSCIFDRIQDIVECTGKGMDILGVKRRDKRLSQHIKQPVCDVIAATFQSLHALGDFAHAMIATQA